MRLDQIVRILEGVPGIRKDGPAFLVPEQIELSVIIGLPSEVLAVGRVTRLEPAAELLSMETQKGERFHFAIEHVAGVKSASAERSAGARGAGFR